MSLFKACIVVLFASISNTFSHYTLSCLAVFSVLCLSFVQVQANTLRQYYGGTFRPLVNLDSRNIQNLYVYQTNGVALAIVGDKTYYPNTDHLGSTRLLSHNGVAAASWSYQSFGDIESILAGQYTIQAPSFQGYDYDSETALYRTPTRLYQPQPTGGGQFLAKDPLQSAPSPYFGFDGNPTNLVDPDGRQVRFANLIQMGRRAFSNNPQRYTFSAAMQQYQTDVRLPVSELRGNLGISMGIAYLPENHTKALFSLLNTALIRHNVIDSTMIEGTFSDERNINMQQLQTMLGQTADPEERKAIIESVLAEQMPEYIAIHSYAGIQTIKNTADFYGIDPSDIRFRYYAEVSFARYSAENDTAVGYFAGSDRYKNYAQDLAAFRTRMIERGDIGAVRTGAAHVLHSLREPIADIGHYDGSSEQFNQQAYNLLANNPNDVAILDHTLIDELNKQGNGDKLNDYQYGQWHEVPLPELGVDAKTHVVPVFSAKPSSQGQGGSHIE